VLCVGVIPGPTQCKDLNSFLVPLVEELLQLEAGVKSSMLKPKGDNTCEPKDKVEPNANGYSFKLRAFLIIIFGDIPASARLLFIKGHNTLTPCCACSIQGVLCHLCNNSVYYIHLMYPHNTIPIQHLHMWMQRLFQAHLSEPSS
jgi:hypothetical protein